MADDETEDFLTEIGARMRVLLLEKMRAGNNVDYYLELRGLPDADRQVIANEQQRIAAEIVQDLTQEIRREYAGDRVRIRASRSPQVIAEEVRAAYNGKNRAAIMSEHGISCSTFYRYIKNK